MPITYPNLTKFRRLITDMVDTKKVTVMQVKRVLKGYCGTNDPPRTQFVLFRDRNAVLGELLSIADLNARIGRYTLRKADALEEGEDVLVSGKKDELPEGYELFKVGNHITTAQWVEFAAETRVRLKQAEQEIDHLKSKLADLKPFSDMAKNIATPKYEPIKRMDV